MKGLITLLALLPFALSKPSHDIIGGKPSEKGKWPWVVSLVRWRPDEEVYRHTCGGSLLTPKYVLTAAHCLEYPPDDYQIKIGIYSQVEDDAEETRFIKRIISHPDYSPGDGYPNDIGVIELDQEVDISNPFVGLAKLPRADDEPVGNPDCWIAGWGRINPDPTNWTSASVLMEVNTAVHDLKTCREIWMEFLNSTETDILDQHICIGLPDLGACHGDSGSPAQCDLTGKGDWTIVGLNSWGTGSRCAAATNAFVRLTWFLDWIREHVPGLPGTKP